MNLPQARHFFMTLIFLLVVVCDAFAAEKQTTFILDPVSGASIKFRPPGWDFQVAFEFEVPTVFYDMNLYLHHQVPVDREHILMQTFMSFCEEEFEPKSELLSDKIKGSLSKFLTHDRLLGINAWTSCQNNSSQQRAFLRIKSQLIVTTSTEVHPNGEMSISMKLLPTISHRNPYNNFDSSNRRSRALSNGDNAGISENNPDDHLQFMATMPPSTSYWHFKIPKETETVYLTYSLESFNKLVNISAATNENSSIKLFATICNGKLADDAILTTVPNEYKSTVIRPNELIPSDLKCQFNISDPLLFITVQALKENSYGTIGVTVDTEKSINDSITNADELFKMGEVRLGESKTISESLKVQPFSVRLIIRMGQVALKVRSLCTTQEPNASLISNRVEKAKTVFVGNFGIGTHEEFYVNRSLFQDIMDLTKCADGEAVNVPENLIFEKTLTNASFEAEETDVTNLVEFVVVGLSTENIANLVVRRATGSMILAHEEDMSASTLSWIHFMMIALVTCSVISFVILFAQRHSNRMRAMRYEIQRRAVLLGVHNGGDATTSTNASNSTQIANEGNNNPAFLVTEADVEIPLEQEIGPPKILAKSEEAPLTNIPINGAKRAPHIGAFKSSNF